MSSQAIPIGEKGMVRKGYGSCRADSGVTLMASPARSGWEELRLDIGEARRAWAACRIAHSGKLELVMCKELYALANDPFILWVSPQPWDLHRDLRSQSM